MEIQHFTIISKGLESVGKALRDNDGLEVVRTELFSMPMQKSRRIMAHVYRNIKDFTLQTTHKLDFCMWWMLEVHSSNTSTCSSQGMVDLGNMFARSQELQLIKAEQAFQIASTITNRFALKHVQSGDWRIKYFEAWAAHDCLPAASYSWICCLLTDAISAPLFHD